MGLHHLIRYVMMARHLRHALGFHHSRKPNDYAYLATLSGRPTRDPHYPKNHPARPMIYPQNGKW